MRRSRGLSQKDAAKIAGLSAPSLRSVESSVQLSVRLSTLELILIALASRSRLTPEEIDDLVAITEMDKPFLNRLNEHSGRVRPVPEISRPTLEDRAQRAISKLVVGGIDSDTVLILEALANRSASNRPPNTSAADEKSD